MRPIMFVGTGSDVGKSILTAAFCRILKQDGFAPAPFKAQNMSLNSYATPEGLEIGRAQAVQAEACGIACSVEMNPVLLKPTTNVASQVVLNGKPLGNRTAGDYFMKTDRKMLFSEAMKSWNRLNDKFHPIVMEGAGSISELNLRDKDITNMRVACETRAATFLVADIDRGGVFASVYGSIKLLPPEEQDLIEGIIINKFRGDMRLFDEGRQIIEELTGKPVLGVIPQYSNIHIEDEDAVPLAQKNHLPEKGKINIAVVRVPRMSNFTDFNLIEQLEGVHIFYTEKPSDLAAAEIVLIPGSKNTIDDLIHLNQTGMTDAILAARNAGKGVYGICGGYQMMGLRIEDPEAIEGNTLEIEGLGLLPVVTRITSEKVTEQRLFALHKEEAAECMGYEIHMGTSESTEEDKPVAWFEDGQTDGYKVDEKCWGSYLHGILDNQKVVDAIIQACCPGNEVLVPDYLTFKEQQYDKLADVVRASVNMGLFYKAVKQD